MKVLLNDHMEELFQSKIKGLIENEFSSKMKELDLNRDQIADTKERIETRSTRRRTVEDLGSGSTE